ncbi:MAG TPA: hypothetical protein VHM91_09675, partial [Verrucomicrobiales bacterium]|nr:hypothetical protein [Verrucomicrobiales bacterium]
MKSLLLRALSVIAVSQISAAADENTPPSSAPASLGPGFRSSPPVQAVKWDYQVHPVETRGTGDKGLVFGTAPAFDTYPASVSQPPVRVYWNCPAPLPDKPAEVIIDYHRPVPATRFVHYYDRTGKRSSWKTATLSSSTDGKEWVPRQVFPALEPDYPQILAIDQPQAARFYRIQVSAMTDNVEKLHTDEIETWYGTTLGGITAPVAAVQSEPVDVRVRVLSPDTPLEGGSLRLRGPAGGIEPPMEVQVPSIPAGGAAEVTVKVNPLQAGEIPLTVELHATGFTIDVRPWTLRARPKFVLKTATPSAAVITETGRRITVSGAITNEGSTPATGVKVTWLGCEGDAGNLTPGQSAPFSLTATAVPGYHEGLLTATASGGARSIIRRGVICPAADRFALKTKEAETQWASNGIELKMDAALSGGGRFSGWLMLFSGAGATIPMKFTGTPEAPELAADIGGAVLRIRPGRQEDTGDQCFDYEVLPHDPESLTPASTKFTVRIAVNDPRTLFRPHFDVFTKEQGPKHGYGDHTHFSPTRLLSVQTDAGTVSMVPDTDNMTWGFAGDFSMNANFDIDLSGPDPAQTKIWQPLLKGPRKFRLTVPIRSGDWWDAYRHVVKDIFKFEQARQWAMPLTQMQMLSVRQMERQENWSPIFN